VDQIRQYRIEQGLRGCVERNQIRLHSVCYSRKESSQGKKTSLMGSRITRAATHLSENEVQGRIQGEQRLWCRQRWEIIYQALKAPRKAEDIARTVGVSLATVHRVISTYKHRGGAAIETPGKGGRRHQHLTLSQERAFLEPFMARAARGEMATAAEIQRAYEEETNQPVAPVVHGSDVMSLIKNSQLDALERHSASHTAYEAPDASFCRAV
jgi:hypothetical protein